MGLRPPKFGGVVDNSEHVILDNPSYYRSFKATLKGKRIHLILKEWALDDSNPRGFYFGVLIPELTEANIGYERHEWHGVLKKQFHFTTTRGLPNKDFWAIINEIKRWAAEVHNVQISDPQSVDF